MATKVEILNMSGYDLFQFKRTLEGYINKGWVPRNVWSAYESPYDLRYFAFLTKGE